MKEVWKSFLGCYEVSNLGRVRRSVGAKTSKAGKILGGWLDGHGYRRITFMYRGRKVHFSLHVLVARLFIGPRPPTKTQVNHKDLDILNNRWTNLEYVTHAENTRHAMEHGVLVGTPAHKKKGIRYGRRRVREIVVSVGAQQDRRQER
jgi:hypothetical protein